MSDTAPTFREAVRQLPPTAWSLCLGTLVNRAGSFLPVFMVLYLTSRHHTPAEAGLVLATAGLGNVAGNALGGQVADRLGRRWTIVVSMLATAALTASFPLFDSLPALTALAALVGIAAQVYRPAAGALLVDVTTPDQRLAAFATLRFAINVGAALGSVLGGFLATRSYVVLFLGNAVACLLYGLTALALLRDVAIPTPARTRGRQPGYRAAVSDGRLVRFLVVAFIAEFVYVQSTVGLPLHVHEVGLSPADFGLLLGVNGVLVLLLELPITSLISRRRPAPVMILGLLLTGGGLALTWFAANLVQLAGTVLVWTLGEMVYTPVAAAYPSRLSPDHLRGRYQGLHGAAMTLGAAAGPLVGGLIFARAEWALWVVCAVTCLGASRLNLTGTGSSTRPAAPWPASNEPRQVSYATGPARSLANEQPHSHAPAAWTSVDNGGAHPSGLRPMTMVIELQVREDSSMVEVGKGNWQMILLDAASIKLLGQVADEVVTFDVYEVHHRDGQVGTYALEL